MHLLSEPGSWITTSEFMDENGIVSHVTGETHIRFENDAIINDSWIELENNNIQNNYRIYKIDEYFYQFESKNATLGFQKGTFHIDRNIIYSNFSIEDSEYNGFEVIIRNKQTCQVYGALYFGQTLINTWKTTMKNKKSRQSW